MVAFSNPEAYETWMGRWSERLAPGFVSFASLDEPARILDVGSETGVLARCLLAKFKETTVQGIEPSESYVAYAREKVADRRAKFEAGDAQTMPYTRGEFDAALALLVLQEIPDPGKAAAEMRRVTRSGGCVAACQWDFVSGMPPLTYFWDSVAEVIPEEQVRTEAKSRNPPGCSDLESLRRLWTDAGMKDVHTARLEIRMEFASFDDYWQPFLSGATPTSSYAATLSNELREALAGRLRTRVLGENGDRAFSMPARALAVRGRVS